MSESDSEGADKQESKGPETAGEAMKEAVGRGLRGGFVATATCVQRTVYPVKEGCLYSIDAVQSYFHPSTARGGGQVPTAEVVQFTQMGQDVESEHSERS